MTAYGRGALTANDLPRPAGFHWRVKNGVAVLVPDFFDAIGLGGGYSMRRTLSGEPLDLDLRGPKDHERILANRASAAEAFGVEAGRLVLSEQVHGAKVAVVGESDAGRGALSPQESLPGADGLATVAAGVPLGAMSADCVVILLADERRRCVAAVHSGREGTAANITAEAVRTLCALGAEPEALYAALGPAARACSYEVGEELRRDFAAFTWGGDIFTISDTRLYLDLPGAVRRELLDSGVRPERIFDAGLCTICRRDLFYSYRRERAAAGRMMGVISIGG